MMPKNQQQTRNNHNEENQQNRQEKLPAENHTLQQPRQPPMHETVQ